MAYNDRSRFREFGEYLHAFQDTWSHQGEPDIPPVCNPKLGWGHAFNRGGWACHLADLTYHWQDKDLIPMAMATYDMLIAQTPGAAKSWDDLKPKIETFAMARSKWEKDSWFDQEKFNDRSFLQEISLPDCVLNGPCPGLYPFQKLIATWKETYERFRDWRPPVGIGAPLSPPVDVVQLLRDFAEGMIRQKENLQAQFETACKPRAIACAPHQRLVSDALRYVGTGLVRARICKRLGRTPADGTLRAGVPDRSNWQKRYSLR